MCALTSPSAVLTFLVGGSPTVSASKSSSSIDRHAARGVNVRGYLRSLCIKQYERNWFILPL